MLITRPDEFEQPDLLEKLSATTLIESLLQQRGFTIF